MLNVQQQLIPIGGALLCAVIGSITDLRNCRIPNWVTGPAIFIGLSLHSITGHWSGLGYSALAGIIASGITLLFWFAGGMGAGDVKLMTAVGCVAGLASLHMLLFSIAIAGAVCALALSCYHGRLQQTLSNVAALILHHSRHGLQSHPDLNLGNPGTLRLPFALPIAAGCLITLCSMLPGIRL